MPARVLGLDLQALFDTGADCSVISTRVWQSIPEEQRPVLEPFNRTLRSVGNHPVDAEGGTTLQMELDGRPLEHYMVVANVTDDLVVGVDLLAPLELKWNWAKGEVEWPQEGILLGDPGSGDVSQPRVSVSDGSSEKDELDLTEYEPLELQDMEVLPYIPRGMDDRLSRRCRSLVHKEELECATTDVAETMCLVRAVQNGNTEVDDKPSPVPEHLAQLYHNSRENLTTDQQGDLANLLQQYQDIFSQSDTDIGRTKLEIHRIPTGDATPIRLPPRRAPMHLRSDIQEQILKMKEQGIVEDCTSSWAFPLVIVKKKDGSNRICVDYRALNQVTVKDGHPLPRLDDSLDALAQATIYTTLDMTSGYHQVEVAPEDRDKTAFVDGRGHHLRYVTMPFGLCNAPSTFQRLMEKVLDGMVFDMVVVYLDDVVIFSRSIKEHMEHLKQVFDRFRQHNLKLKPRKCELCRTKVKYLGHVVSAEGVATDPSLVEKVKDWPTPRTVRQVRSFLGLCNYYRSYVPSYGTLVEPMIRLTDKGAKFEWTPACQQAFETLKVKLTTAPILAYPNLTGRFILDTDASDTAIGAVLSQEQDGQEKVIGYGSKALSKEERNYCVTRRELLAVVHFVDHFRYYLQGSKPFLVRTDHASLRWLMSQKEPRDQLARWIQKLDTYALQLDHRPGKHHGNADSMSRRGTGKCFRGGHCLCQEGEESDDPEEVETIGALQDTGQEGHGAHPMVETNSPTEQEEADSLVKPEGLQIGLSLKDVQDQQEADPGVRVIRAWRESRDQPPSKEELSPYGQDVKYWCGRWKQLVIRDGLLQYRWEAEDPKESPRYRIVTPRSLKATILTALHDLKSAGHMGITRTKERAKKCAFLWPNMLKEVERWVRRCQLCQQRKAPPYKKRAKLVTYQVGTPWERIAADVAGPFPTTDRGMKYILVVQDYFTKWVEVHPMPDQTAETVASVLVDQVISRFGCPRELHSDQGSNFESRVMKEVNRLMGVRKTRTTPYHPRGDGMVERYNRTLENMLSIWTNERQTDWDQHIPLLSMAYRSSPHKSTGETPNLLMLGREVTLPVDLVMENPPAEEGEEPPNLSEYAANLLEKMHTINEAAQQVMTQQMVSQKRHYDQNVRLTDYKPGDVVWLHHLANKKGRSPKLRRRWTGPYVIRTKLSDVTYRIQASPRSRPQIIHGDRIKACYGITAEDLGFSCQGVPEQPAAVVPELLQEDNPVPVPEGTVDDPEPRQLGAPENVYQPGEGQEQPGPETPPPSLQQPLTRGKGRASQFAASTEQPEKSERLSTSPRVPPRRTKAGRAVRAPKRFGWD